MPSSGTWSSCRFKHRLCRSILPFFPFHTRHASCSTSLLACGPGMCWHWESDLWGRLEVGCLGCGQLRMRVDHDRLLLSGWHSSGQGETVLIPLQEHGLMIPSASIQGEARLQLEAAAWYPSTSAAVSGALILGAIRHVWPLAKEYRARRARAGLALALVLGVAVMALNAFLCVLTPFCL